MPLFFNKDQLTKAQYSRWQSASATYVATLATNRALRLKKHLKTLNSQDMVAVLDGIPTDANMWLGGASHTPTCDTPGHPKSALFARLLDGKEPLVYPPPISFGYPWYDVIEGQGPWDIIDLCSIATFSAECVRNKYPTRQEKIILNQALWDVVEYHSPTEATVTYQNWDRRGLQWRLKKHKVRAANCSQFISATHNKSLSKITNLDQLIDEKRWQVTRKFQWLALALDAYSAREHVAQAPTELSKAIAQQEVATGHALLKSRREQGLPDRPTPEEIEKLTLTAVSEFLNGNYSLDAEGNLYTHIWQLHKDTQNSSSDTAYSQAQVPKVSTALMQRKIQRLEQETMSG